MPMRARLLLPFFTLLAALAASLPAAPRAFAQEAVSAASLTDDKLHAFIIAALKVGDLIDQWEPKIEAAKTPAEQEQLKQQANSELVAAIESGGGMTLPEYRAISSAAENDPALQERIIKLLQEGGPQKQ